MPPSQRGSSRYARELPEAFVGGSAGALIDVTASADDGCTNESTPAFECQLTLTRRRETTMLVDMAAAITAVVGNRERVIGVNASGRGLSEGSDN
ncbi:hypothetical protein [Paraburkholderia haematera]|uniref:Uncharacterized protein n=1 Tax=Paraburkholderia haematera TaxID=2793077 RepID=A0ABM8RQF9_9BURK|nr:hypothetical protein [Paraburkholderia haematera]CAE6765925.1 hypothetical protein R69888_03636 [Paraburkholderia haematera]